MGSRGPIPKHPDQRRRRNVKKAAPAKKVAKKATAATKKAAPVTTLPTPAAPKRVPVPRVDADWHSVAKAWYKSLADSGQSKYYQPSDWATAVLIAESMSRDLQPQFVGFTEEGDVIKEQIPLKGASLAAYLKAMSVLLVTEGDRRRMECELEQPGQEVDPDAERAEATVTNLQSRLGG